MAATLGRTGRWGNVSVNSVVINITMWTAKPSKAFADSTDSGNYDATTHQLFRSQAPGDLGLDGTISGYYDFGGTTDANFTQLFKIDGPFPVVLGLSPTVNYATFMADFTDDDISVNVAGATMITFSANYKSNGIITWP